MPGLKSYETAWTWLHKFRRAMVRPGRGLLNGRVEVDECYIGAPEDEMRGRGSVDKTPVVVAVEEKDKGIGRLRRKQIPNASGSTLDRFLQDSVAVESAVHTDGWKEYRKENSIGHEHEVTVLKGNQEPASELLPRVHRLIQLLKRWLMGTHQGALRPQHLDYYLEVHVSVQSPQADEPRQALLSTGPAGRGCSVWDRLNSESLNGMNLSRSGHQMRCPAGCDLEIEARPEFVDNGKQAINGKPLQFHLADARKIRGGDAGPMLRFANGEFVAYENLEDFCGKNAFQLPNIRIRVAKITVNIAAPAYKFHVVFLHFSISFSRLSLSIARSISCLGVFTPWVDFF
jgi:ISXO2-like transposase domain